MLFRYLTVQKARLHLPVLENSYDSSDEFEQSFVSLGLLRTFQLSGSS